MIGTSNFKRSSKSELIWSSFVISVPCLEWLLGLSLPPFAPFPPVPHRGSRGCWSRDSREVGVFPMTSLAFGCTFLPVWRHGPRSNFCKFSVPSEGTGKRQLRRSRQKLFVRYRTTKRRCLCCLTLACVTKMQKKVRTVGTRQAAELVNRVTNTAGLNEKNRVYSSNRFKIDSTWTRTWSRNDLKWTQIEHHIFLFSHGNYVESGNIWKPFWNLLKKIRKQIWYLFEKNLKTLKVKKNFEKKLNKKRFLNRVAPKTRSWTKSRQKTARNFEKIAQTGRERAIARRGALLEIALFKKKKEKKNSRIRRFAWPGSFESTRSTLGDTNLWWTSKREFLG